MMEDDLSMMEDNLAFREDDLEIIKDYLKFMEDNQKCINSSNWNHLGESGLCLIIIENAVR
jgi:hypothetical protein